MPISQYNVSRLVEPDKVLRVSVSVYEDTCACKASISLCIYVGIVQVLHTRQNYSFVE